MLKYLIASIPIILPFSVAPFLLDGGLVPGFISLGLYGVVLWAVIAWRAKREEPIAVPHVPMLALIAAAFIIWSGIGIAYTIAPADAVFLLVKWFAVAIFASGLSLLLATDKALSTPLLKGIIISAIATSCVGVAQLLPILEYVLRTPDFTYQVTGLLGHKNLYSSWLMLLVPLVALAIYRLGLVWKTVGILSLVLLLGMIFLVQSRSVWVAMVLAGLLVAAVFILGSLFSKPVKGLWLACRAKFTISLLLCLLAITVFVVARPEMLKNVRQRVYSSINYMGPKTQANETIKERFFLWGHTWQMILEKPMLGHGGGSWRILFPKYGLQNNRSQQGYVHFQRPHNDWLWVWAEYGLMGLVLWSLFWVGVLVLLVRRFWRQENPTIGIASLLLFYAVLCFLINGIFDFPIERSTHLGLMGIIIAMVLAMAGKQSIKIISARWPWVMLALGLGCSILLYIRLRGDVLAVQSYRLHAAGNYPLAIAMAAEAKSFIYDMDGVSAPMDFYEGNGWLAMGKNAEALEAFQAAYASHPNHLLVLNNLGSAWQFMGESDSARHYYRKAIAISPRFEEPLLNMGALYFNERNTDSAYHYLSTVYPDSKNPRYRPSIDALLKVEVRLLKQTLPAESPQWQRLDSLEHNSEQLFNMYLKAWEKKNKTYEALSREEWAKALLAQ